MLEPEGVDVVAVDCQPVSLVDPFDTGRGRAAGGGEGVAQAGDVTGQGSSRARRSVVTPYGLDEGVQRDDGSRSRRQRAEQSSWDRATHRDGTVRSVHDQGPEDPDQHGLTLAPSRVHGQGARRVPSRRLPPRVNDRRRRGEDGKRQPTRRTVFR